MKRKNEMRKVREQVGRVVLEEGLVDMTKLNELAKRYQELKNESEISKIERKIDELNDCIILAGDMGELRDSTIRLEERVKGLMAEIDVIKSAPAKEIALKEDEESWKEKYNRLEADYVHLKIRTDTLKGNMRKFMREEF